MSWLKIDFLSHVSEITKISALVVLAHICTWSNFGNRLRTFKCTIPRPDLFEKSKGVETIPTGPGFGLIPASKSNNIIRYRCLRFFGGGPHCPIQESNIEFDKKRGFLGMRIKMSEFFVPVSINAELLATRNMKIESVCFDGRCM